MLTRNRKDLNFPGSEYLANGVKSLYMCRTTNFPGCMMSHEFESKLLLHSQGLTLWK